MEAQSLRTPRTLCTAHFWYFDDCDCSKQHSKDCSAWSCKRCGFWLFSLALFILIASVLSVDGAKVTRNATATDSVGYPICELRHSALNAELSTVDLVYFAITAANDADDETAVLRDLRRWFGAEFVGAAHNASALRVFREPRFLHFENVLDGYDVVAIGGAHSRTDALLRVALWSEVLTLRVLSLAIPLTHILPLGFVRSYIDFASFAEYAMAPDLRTRFDEPIYDYATRHILEVHNSSLVVLGSSLGAGSDRMSANAMV